MMNIGDRAPEVLGKDEQGREVRLSDYKGRKLVLYFSYNGQVLDYIRRAKEGEGEA